jgi:diacylglycerol kinase family enzyme
MRVTLIHNPKSGDDDHTGEELAALMRHAGHQVAYYRSTGPWRAAIDDDVELVAVAGGDGTVSAVAKATAGRGIPIGVLPMGTANNIAVWLGLSGIPPEELIAGWARASVTPFDIGVANGPWGTNRFLESVGVGLLAGMISEIDVGGSRYVNELNRRDARITAARDVLERVLRQSKAVRCELLLDEPASPKPGRRRERVISGDYLLVEVLNFGTAGPNLNLAPHAEGADGLLDVVVVEEHERTSLEQQLPATGADPLYAPARRVHQARRVVIRCEEPCLWHLDDELWNDAGAGQSVEAEASVEGAAVTFLVPSRD